MKIQILLFWILNIIVSNSKDFKLAAQPVLTENIIETETTCGGEILKVPDNVDLTCQIINSDKICLYNCKPYFIPYEYSGKIRNEIKCIQADGNWIGIKQFRSFTCREDCGKRQTTPKPLVVNGIPVDSISWPWHAAIFWRNKKSSPWFYICGGSLIRNSVVLTAAHCLTQLDSGQPFHPNQYRVILGAESPNFNSSGKYSQTLTVRRIYISENYDPKKEHQADIALLHLNTSVIINDHVLPVCLPNDYALDLNAIKSGRVGEVVGFGIDESKNISQKLKQGSLLVVSHAECYHSLYRVLSESQFCAGNRHEDKWTTVCNGDSGGGFVSASAVVQKYYIHGIVSTGDPAVKHGVCQNYTVFTRVFQFIFWIRDVLEKISGENIRELASNTKFPYIQRGSETSYNHLSPIPREWDNLVTSVELLYYKVDPNILIQSLQFNMGVLYVNLSHVQFIKKFQEHDRVVLPYIRSFILDKSELDCTGIHEEGTEVCSSDNPREYSKSQIKKLLFFDKEYDREWRIEDILLLNTNIELIAHTYRLININHEEGLITLQVSFASEILQNLPTIKSIELNLTQLVLANCDWNISNIIEKGYHKTIRRLVLSNVTFIDEGRNLQNLLKMSTNLEEFRFLENDSIEEEEESEQTIVQHSIVYLANLPKSIKHLSIFKKSLHYSPCMYQDTGQDLGQIRIFFPESEELRNYLKLASIPPPTIKLPNLETFYCNHCDMDDKLIQHFTTIFSNVKHLFLIGENRLNFSKLANELKKCDFMFLRNISKLIGIQDLKLELESLEVKSQSQLILEKIGTNTGWRQRNCSEKINLNFNFDFEVLGLKYLWTSFEDFETGTRLTSWEKLALSTGHYKYNGDNGGGEIKQLAQLPKIPDRLQSELKSIEIVNAAIDPGLLIWSLKSADILTSLILDKVNLIGPFEDTAELPQNLTEYILRRVIVFKSFDYILTEPNLETLIPFGITEAKNTEDIRAPFNFLQPQTQSKVARLEIMYDDCIKISVDYDKMTLISTMSYVQERQTLQSLHLYNFTSISVRLLISEFVRFTAPPYVEELNLYIIDSKLYGDEPITVADKVAQVLKSLKSLKKLRLSFEIDQDRQNSRTIVQLSNLREYSCGLEIFTVSGGHIVYSPNIFMKNLKILFFESCTFDQDISDNFEYIFKSEKFGIVSYGYNTDEKIHSDANEKILFDVMKDMRTRWILGYLGKYQNETKEYIMENVLNNVKEDLESVQMDSEHFAFLIEKNSSGQWFPGKIQNDENDNNREEFFQRETAKLRHDDLFGKHYCNNNYPFPEYL